MGAALLAHPKPELLASGSGFLFELIPNSCLGKRGKKKEGKRAEA